MVESVEEETEQLGCMVEAVLAATLVAKPDSAACVL